MELTEAGYIGRHIVAFIVLGVVAIEVQLVSADFAHYSVSTGTALTAASAALQIPNGAGSGPS